MALLPISNDTPAANEPTLETKAPSVDRILRWRRTALGLAVRCQESDQEEHSDDRSANMDATPPPLGAKLTGYRLLNITIVFSFGIAKAILTYKGRSTEPTTLDWVGGALLAVFLYWMGLYEQRDSRFFQVDLAPGIGYCAKRVVGGAMGVPFCFSGAFTAVSLSNSAVIPLEHSFPQVPAGAWFGVVIGFYVSALNLLS
ncbi:hypothetical protein EDB84DRAFT_62163 [Lactarius hengduanensis]|nr:hypothetical protein EDB84DRAFT_62163 [Lactarius hengduanensis]